MSATPDISVGIVARRRIPELDRLVDALLLIDGPPAREIVVGVETPGASEPTETRDERGVRWIALPARRGIAYNRNRVLDAVRGGILLGIDDDCEPDAAWMTSMLGALEDPRADAVVGEIAIPPAGFLGDSISALGLPAGGAAGFSTMFYVAPDCTTSNLSAGNCAVRTDVLRELGGYDESMTYGGEDTELAYRLGRAGRRIVHASSAVIVHPARTSLREFVRWSFVRGRAKRQFSRKVPIAGFVRERLVSFGSILKSNAADPKILLVVPLLTANIALQWTGFVIETLSPTRAPRGT